MPESTRTRLWKLAFNLFPPYRGTGAVITYIAADWREVHIRLPLNLFTRNIYGVIYGGSLYAAIDPIYAIMVMHVLGKGYAAWDKAATIRFRKPGRSTLYATFRLDDAEIAAIRTALAAAPAVDRTYQVELADKTGLVCASFEKVVHVRRETKED